MSMLIEDTRSKPRCPCCGGTGMHEYRPYVTASPEDRDAECSLCEGSGASWFEGKAGSCSGARSLRGQY